MAVALPYIAVAITAVSAQQSYVRGKEAAKQSRIQTEAQRAALAAQERMAEVEAQRARISQVREARIRRAKVIASTTEMGSGTSGTAGATAGITTQAASNIGLINQTQTFAREATAASQRAASAGGAAMEAQAKGQQWQTIGTIFGADKEDFTTIFNKVFK